MTVEPAPGSGDRDLRGETRFGERNLRADRLEEALGPISSPDDAPAGAAVADRSDPVGSGLPNREEPPVERLTGDDEELTGEPAVAPHLHLVSEQGLLRPCDLSPCRHLVAGPERESLGLIWGGADAQSSGSRRVGYCRELLESLVEIASSVVDAPATASLFEGGTLVRVASSRSRRSKLGTAVPIAGTLCGRAVLTREVIRTGNLISRDEHSPSTRHLPAVDCCGEVRSHLAVPLLDKDVVLGLLVLTSEHAEWFDDHAQAEVVVLAGVAARALAGAPVPNEQSWRSAIIPAPVNALGFWSWDAGTGTTRCSPSVVAMLGLPSEDAISLAGVRHLIHPSEHTRFATLIDELINGGSISCTFRVITPQGERHVHAWCETRWDSNGYIVGAWGAALDVTAREKEAVALRSSVAGLRSAKGLTGLGVWEWRPDDGTLEWSEEMYRFLGLEPGDIQPTLELWHRAVHPEDRHRAMHLDSLASADGGGTVATFRVRGFDEVERHVQSWSTVMPAGDGASRVVAGAVVDVTRSVIDRAELDRRSATDPVTGLANRLGFERWMAQLQDSTDDVGLLLLDLDRFKMVNDSLGHPVGDRLLFEVARRLEKVAPSGSLTARMGGDEFVVVPPTGSRRSDLQSVAQDVLKALRDPIIIEGTGEVLFCPVSIGVTSSAGRPADTNVLLAEADLALYRAKDQGRDRYAVFDDALREKVRRRHSTEQTLRSAMKDGRLVLQYQPIVDFRTDRLVGAEALVRMRTEDGQLLMPPDGFIAVAEDIGLVIDVDCWVVEAALDQLARWWQYVPPSHVPWLAVNVSPRSMEHPRLVRTILDGIRRRGLPPHLLKVELTESSFLSSLRGGAKALQSLIAHQIPVGIDDFGTGYSALAHLSNFNLDFMKIDRSFVARLGHDARADAVVEAVVALAHAHLMKVTAEGVETARQARRLSEMNCDYAQGFHFGRPGDAASILRG